MFKKERIDLVFKSAFTCPKCHEQKKHITVFCLQDKDTYDITICLNCCKDPLTLLRLAEKPPYNKAFNQQFEKIFEYYGTGIVAELNKKSKLFEGLREIQKDVSQGMNVGFMKSGIKKK